VASQISTVSASSIAGTVAASNIGTISASSIAGSLVASQIGAVSASAINGVIITSQLAPLDLTNILVTSINPTLGIDATGKLTSAASMGANLLPNPGFEQGLTGATQGPGSLGSPIFVSSNLINRTVHGSYCAQCVLFNSTVGGWSQLYWVVDCAPGDSIAASAWYDNYTTAVGQPRLYVSFLDSSGAIIGSPTIVTGAISIYIWTQLQNLAGPAPSGTVAASINIQVYNNGTTPSGYWYWDDVSAIRSTPAGLINGLIASSQISTVSASQINGLIVASQISTISASQINGLIVASQISTIAASQINGTIAASNIGTISASSIVGALVASQISTVFAGSITGGLTTSQISTVSASSINGQLVASQISTVSASSIAGTISASNIGTISASSITGTFTAGQIGSIQSSAIVVNGNISVGALGASTGVSVKYTGNNSTGYFGAGSWDLYNSGGYDAISANANAGSFGGQLEMSDQVGNNRISLDCTGGHGVIRLADGFGSYQLVLDASTSSITTYGPINFNGSVSSSAGAFVGYIYCNVGGTSRRIPYYAV
jgi:hypothetical protein